MKPDPRHSPLLELRHVSRYYDVGDTRVAALDDVSLTVDTAEFVTIVGPSGSGKSTLLQIIGLLDRPTDGQITLDGRDLAGLSDAERTRLRLDMFGFVFQRFHLLHDLTALENVELPLEAAGVSAEERRARAAALLRAVGLGDRMHFRPSRLSGGQRQRVAIARALANNPRIILADEPTGELHSEDKARVIDLFRQFHDEGRAIVIVTHDMEVAAMAERRIEIRDGHVAEQAAPSLAVPRAPVALRHGGLLLPPGYDDDGAPPVRDATVRALATAHAPVPATTPLPLANPPLPSRRAPRRSRFLPAVALLIVAIVAAYAAYAWWTAQGQPAAPPSETVFVKRFARGELRPESEAVVRSLVSGVITRLSVRIGEDVVENQEIARTRAPDGTIQIITAPWRGSITNLPVHEGDSVVAGAPIAAVGDVSRLHVETDDVDEFMIARVRTGQAVTVAIDAIDGRELAGRVRTVALRSEQTVDGDDHYPVTIDLDWTPADVRAGMTVRVYFPEQ